MDARHSLGRIYGEIVRNTDVAGVILAEHHYHDRLRMPGHWHDYSMFYLVLKGGCVDAHAGTEARCTPRTLMFHPAGTKHASDYRGTGARTFTVELRPDWMERIGAYAGGWDRSWEFRDGLPCWAAVRLYNEFRRPDAVTPLVIEGLVLELLAEATRYREDGVERGLPLWLREAREILGARFTEDASLTTLAQAVGVHPSHLAREFRRHYHCTPGDYIRRLRLEQSQRELATSDSSLAEIATAAGFSDQSHFCRTFKRHTSLTPTEYRQRWRPR
jgi:AraC family transcriptional regulator